MKGFVSPEVPGRGVVVAEQGLTCEIAGAKGRFLGFFSGQLGFVCVGVGMLIPPNSSHQRCVRLYWNRNHCHCCCRDCQRKSFNWIAGRILY